MEVELTSDATVPATSARTTRQKRAVASALDATEGFTSAQELHAALRRTGDRVGLATVYSQLRSLAASGEIDSMRSETGETVFRKCVQASHHHHLVCRRCGRTVEVEAPELERWADDVGERHGFGNLAHVLEITGICAHCREVPTDSSE